MESLSLQVLLFIYVGLILSFSCAGLVLYGAIKLIRRALDKLF